jgi:hypothetical protein
LARLNPCPSFINPTRKLVGPSESTDQQQQPDFVRHAPSKAINNLHRQKNKFFRQFEQP